MGNMTVVCDGVTSDILPGLDDSQVHHFHTSPMGPHPVGSFEVWVPIEYLPEFLSFILYNRGDLTIFMHPLGKTELEDHTTNALWLGESYRLGV